MEALYVLNFEDGSHYEGGDVVNPNWSKAPDKLIKSMEVIQSSGDSIILKGYEFYNFFIEAVASIGQEGNIKGDTKLTYIFALGKKGNQITSFRISLGDYHGHKEDDITLRKLIEGQEYYGKPSSGWKKGIT